MYRIREAIVVEGRYDKNKLSQIVDTVIIETGGFGIFNDCERLEYLRALAKRRGIVILTDGDGAGFVIRRYLKGAIPPEEIKNAYIPDIYGKERRKRTASAEGKLGVEGMPDEVIIEALRRAGATFEDETAAVRGEITKTRLYEDGLLGGAGSAELRKALAHELSLPERIGSNALLEALNGLYSADEYESALAKVKSRID